MNDLEKAKAALTDKAYPISKIAELSKVPLGTLRNYQQAPEKMVNAGWGKISAIARAYDAMNESTAQIKLTPAQYLEKIEGYFFDNSMSEQRLGRLDKVDEESLKKLLDQNEIALDQIDRKLLLAGRKIAKDQISEYGQDYVPVDPMYQRIIGLQLTDDVLYADLDLNRSVLTLWGEADGYFVHDIESDNYLVVYDVPGADKPSKERVAIDSETGTIGYWYGEKWGETGKYIPVHEISEHGLACIATVAHRSYNIYNELIANNNPCLITRVYNDAVSSSTKSFNARVQKLIRQADKANEEAPVDATTINGIFGKVTYRKKPFYAINVLENCIEKIKDVDVR